MSTPNNPSRDVVDVAKQLANLLDARHIDYCLGGAISLGFWAAPRGTLDVDITLYLTADRPGEVVWLLQDLGCEVDSVESLRMLREHGFCRVKFDDFRVDVFLPITPFYETARHRRRRVDLDGQEVMIWDAETLTVFKLMFFRDKDLVDIQQIVRTQGPQFDRDWVQQQVELLFGKLDPRVARWYEITRQVQASKTDGGKM